MSDLVEKVNSSHKLQEVPIKATEVRYAGESIPVSAVAAGVGVNAAVGNLAAAIGVGVGIG
jgi:hypothetical protein